MSNKNSKVELKASLDELIAEHEEMLKHPGTGGRKRLLEAQLVVMKVLRDLDSPIERRKFVAITSRYTGIAHKTIERTLDFLLAWNAIKEEGGNIVVRKTA